MSRISIATATGITAAVTTLSLLTAGTAMANDGDVIRRGSCTGTTDWKLKASPENGWIEVEAEVDSNRNGQTWSWYLWHDGARVRGAATTRPPSGSFEVRRVVVNAAGTDTIVFQAWNPRTGEQCVGDLNLNF